MPVLAFVVSAAMLVWFVSNPLFGSVLDLLDTLRLRPLLLAVALVPILQWLRGWRFSILLRRSLDPPCRRHFTLAAQLSFLNLVLPFKIGDLSFPLLARRTVGADLLQGTVAILWCRLNDLCTAVAILLLGGAWIIPGGHLGSRLALAIIGVACLLLPLALAPLGSLLRCWRGFARLLAMLPDGAQVQYGRSMVWGLTVAIWSTHSLICCLAVKAVADISVIAVAFAGAASNLAFALPVTGVAGLGPPQAAWATALHLTGAGWETAIATGLLMYGCILLGVILTAAPTVVDRMPRPRAAMIAASATAGRRLQ